MDFVGEKYYKLNRTLLLWLGLWPYQSTVSKKIKIIFFQTLFISLLICQLSIFLVRKYSYNLLIKVAMSAIINIIYLVKYNACLVLTSNMRSIFDRIQSDWNMLKSQAEIEIIRGYASNAKSHTIFLASFCSAALLGSTILTCVLDVTTRSQPRQMITIAEHFIDKEKYFYTVLIHIFVATYAGCMTLSSILTMLMSYVLHTCALFKIACLANIMTNSFATLYFVLIGLGLASTTLTLLHLLNNIVSPDNRWDILVPIGLIIIHFYYLFMANYVGQGIIDNSTDVCRISYSTQWYVAPLWTQKMLLFVMRRSGKSSSLVAGLFRASLEGFATLTSMSLSYVMLVHSTRAQHKKVLENE